MIELLHFLGSVSRRSPTDSLSPVSFRNAIFVYIRRAEDRGFSRWLELSYNVRDSVTDAGGLDKVEEFGQVVDKSRLRSIR